MIVCGNKTDLLFDQEGADALKEHVEGLGLPYFSLSAATHQGVKPLIQAIAAKLAELPPVKVYEADYVPPMPKVDTSAEVSIEVEDHYWFVEAPWLGASAGLHQPERFRVPELAG